MGKRKLIDITFEEAIDVLKLSNCYDKEIEYKLEPWNPLPDSPHITHLCYYGHDQYEVAASFSDHSKNVFLFEGFQSFREYYNIIKYLEKKDFDLELPENNKSL